MPRQAEVGVDAGQHVLRGKPVVRPAYPRHLRHHLAARPRTHIDAVRLDDAADEGHALAVVLDVCLLVVEHNAVLVHQKGP